MLKRIMNQKMFTGPHKSEGSFCSLKIVSLHKVVIPLLMRPLPPNFLCRSHEKKYKKATFSIFDVSALGREFMSRSWVAAVRTTIILVGWCPKIQFHSSCYHWDEGD